MLIKPDSIVDLDYSHPLIKGRVGCWVLNEKSGEFLRDACGHSNLSMAANAPRWIPGGLNFDTGVEYASGAHNPAFDVDGGGFTVIVKARTSYTSNPQYILNKNFGSSPTPWWGLAISATNAPYDILHFYWFSSGSTFAYGPHTASDGEWHTFGGVREAVGNTLKVFQDGIDVTVSGPIATHSADNTGSIYLGGRADLSATRDFVGDIEYAYVFNRELSSAEIAALHADPYAGMNIHSPVFYLVIPSGGTVYNVTVSDGFGIGDSPASGTVFNTILSDGFASGDSAEPDTTFLASILDGLTLGDSRSANAVFGVSISDGVILGDSTSSETTFSATISDGFTLGDVLSVLSDFSSSISDGIVFGDSTTATKILNALVSDGLSFGDSAVSSVVFNVDISDGIQFADAISAIVTFGATVSEGITFGDSTTGSIPSNATGIVSITFSVRGTSVTFNVKKPSGTFTPRKPSITFDI